MATFEVRCGHLILNKVKQFQGLFLTPVVCFFVAIDAKGYLCQSRDHDKWQGCRSTLGVNKGL